MLQKEKEKCRHDASAHDLPVIPVGATVTYINKDLKSWSIGRVESHEGRSSVPRFNMPITPLNTNN